MLLYKQKKTQGPKGNRILVIITVLGSAGPIRFVVNEEDLVADVIDTALKAYAREGRRPVLGSDMNALSPWESIGSQGTRNFVLCKKPSPDVMESVERKGSGHWKAWIHKSLSIKISSH